MGAFLCDTLPWSVWGLLTGVFVLLQLSSMFFYAAPDEKADLKIHNRTL